MADINGIKLQIIRRVAEGRTEEALDYAKTVIAELTGDDRAELESWVAQHSHEAVQPSVRGDAGQAKWLQVVDIMKPGETLREVFPRLPKQLRDFVNDEVKRAKQTVVH